jgi:hypothetical protein
MTFGIVRMFKVPLDDVFHYPDSPPEDGDMT